MSVNPKVNSQAQTPPALTRWLVLAGCMLIVDQLTKLWFDSSLRYGERLKVLPFFDFTLLYNPGAAFSFLADQAGWQRWFFTVLGLGAAGFILWMMHKNRTQTRLLLALSLILSGALGHVIERELMIRPSKRRLQRRPDRVGKEAREERGHPQKDQQREGFGHEVRRFYRLRSAIRPALMN